MEFVDTILPHYSGACYLFDIGVLKQRVETLRSALPAGTDICYAIKANPFLTREIAPWVERLEICSPGEWEICRQLGVPSEKMVISGVNKPEWQIAALAEDGDFRGIITVESLLQWQWLAHHAQQAGRTLPVLLRLTNGSQFGINESDILEILHSPAPQLEVRGIQFFSGTQKQSVKKLRRELNQLDSLLLKIWEECGISLEELEYGTGFPVAYFEPEGFDEASFLKEFSELLQSLQCGAHITLEIGRSIAASCGKYYTRIVDKKTNKGQNYLLTDGGMNHLVYFGQQMAMSLPPFFVVGKQDWPAADTWNICGSLCSMNDITVKQAPLPPVEVGDILCFEQTGAYCMTEGMSLFLSRDLPAVYVKLENGELHCIRRKIETAQFNLPQY